MRTHLLTVAAVACIIAIAPTAASSQTQPALTYTQPLSPQAVQMVQQHLRQQGAYGGQVDGVWGPDSQAALQRYQQAHGLQVTGQLNQATIATLGLPSDQLLSAGQPVASVPTDAVVAGDMLSRRSVQTIQSRLRELNYYRGRADGIWGGATQEAVERFQQGRGLQVNGQPSPATVAALGLDQAILVPAR